MIVTSCYNSIFCLIAYLATTVSAKCLNVSFSLSQRVENEGFHREIKWLLESITPLPDEWHNHMCQLAISLNIPAGMYVYPDQLADLNRMGLLSAFVEGEVNVEIAEHEATGHTTYIFLNGKDVERINIDLPIHLRYQRARIGGGFGKVSVSKPSLLVRCEKEDFCDKFVTVSAPCDLHGDKYCKWKNVTYTALFYETEFFVPIGDLDHFPFVSIITLLLGCCGCIYVLSLLSNNKLA